MALDVSIFGMKLPFQDGQQKRMILIFTIEKLLRKWYSLPVLFEQYKIKNIPLW